jgi:hypothetical protein
LKGLKSNIIICHSEKKENSVVESTRLAFLCGVTCGDSSFPGMTNFDKKPET